jgi:hypothetical protein
MESMGGERVFPRARIEPDATKGEVMRKLLTEVDGLLRGELEADPGARGGPIPTRPVRLIAAAVLLGVLYGVFMGLYAVLRPRSPSFLQLLATTAKVPLLFLLTLAVTFPSLYVFSALVNARPRWEATGRLLLAAIVVDLSLLASFGPVTGFFTLSTESYPFMIVLNVLFFAVAGVAGLLFLRRALTRALVADPADAGGSARRARAVFRIWVLIYAAVGAQMGWLLRPFIGSPDAPFSLFRPRTSNFFEAIIRTIAKLFS